MLQLCYLWYIITILVLKFVLILPVFYYQRWSRGHKARGQGQGHKKIRGQGQGQPFRGQTLSRPRTGMLEAKDQGHKRKCSPKKKRSSQKFFRRSPKKKKKRSSQRSPQKNVFEKIFQALHKILTIQKILLSSSRGQANFRGLQASRPRPRTSKCVLEAKDVLEDSTSVYYYVTLNFFLLSTYFWLTLYFNGFSQKANFFYNQKRQRIFSRVPQKHGQSAKAFLPQL